MTLEKINIKIIYNNMLNNNKIKFNNSIYHLIFYFYIYFNLFFLFIKY